MIARTGLGYHNTKSLVSKAGAKSLSICEYLESQEIDERKKVARDRIIGHLSVQASSQDANVYVRSALARVCTLKRSWKSPIQNVMRYMKLILAGLII